MSIIDRARFVLPVGTVAIVALSFAASSCKGAGDPSSLRSPAATETVPATATVTETPTGAAEATPTPTAQPTPEITAGEALELVIDYVSKGQFGRQWEGLHPAQQEFIPKELYVLCRDEAAAGVDVKSVKVLETFEEDSPIPGTELVLPSAAITAEVAYKQGLFSDTDTDTFHLFLVDGVWRWVDPDPDPYKSGECPD